MNRPAFATLAVTVLFCAAAEGADGDWPHYGRDAGGSRHSPLDQIDASNLEQLDIAWQFRTGELGQGAEDGDSLTFEATPVLWRGALYFSTAFGTAFAIDAATGEERWRFDSGVRRDISYAEVVSRGVSVWKDPARDQGSPCGARVYLGNIAGRLYSLDAANGQPCTDFGESGFVDLRRDARPRELGEYTITSPSAIAGERVINGLTPRSSALRTATAPSPPREYRRAGRRRYCHRK